MRDNTLTAALRDLGHDALLLPTYTPIRTDEEDLSQQRVFFGGINVYMEQKWRLFRRTPWWLDRLLNSPRLLRWVSRFAVSVRAEELGELTLSMLDGTTGNQAKEIEKLVQWLQGDMRPDVILLSNVLISGMAGALKDRLKIPVVAVLQGDDIFLESLPENVRARAIARIRTNCTQIDSLIATCRYYADFMAGYLSVPRDKIHVVYPGIKFSETTARPPNPIPTIGYFARIAPEKGLHLLADAFIHLRQQPGAPRARLRFSGWLGKHNHGYLEAILKKLDAAGLRGEVDHVDSPTYEDKMRFLSSIDVFSVPAPYREPKGLYVLEALAHGVPAVQPSHGSFPELIEHTGGGILVEPNNPVALADGLGRMLADNALRRETGERGRHAVRERFSAETMARNTLAILQQFTS